MTQPMQPIVRADDHVIRFQENAIVRYLLDVCGMHKICDMNHLAIMNFSNEDREQFAQLIGYSVSSYGDLSYVSKESAEKADALAEKLR